MEIDFKKYVGITEDFPKEGISFKDVSPLLANAEAFQAAIDEMAKIAAPYKPDFIVGPESRGFIFGVPLALKLGCGFVMARKPGKLPGKVSRVEYALEYGTSCLEIPSVSIEKGKTAILVDDLLATGGTFAATEKLLTEGGMNVPLAITFIELSDLEGWKAFKAKYASLVKYPH